MMLFSVGYRSPVGTTEDHGLRDRAEQLQAKSTEEVKASWLQAVEQMRMLAANAEDLAGDYELSQIELKLGFTAAGTVVFIAQAGIEATITATFKRRETRQVERAVSKRDGSQPQSKPDRIANNPNA